MIYPGKSVLSDKKENLVLPSSHFKNLFLSTLKITDSITTYLVSQNKFSNMKTDKNHF